MGGQLEAPKKRLDASEPLQCTWVVWKMGLNFVGPLKTSKLHRRRYIVIATKYHTKWVEAQVLRDNSTLSMATFIYEQIFTRYDIAIQITSDRGGNLFNHVIKLLTIEFKIFHSYSSPYYTRTNSQVEATNKILVSLIYKSCKVEEDWEERLSLVLSAYCTTYKVTTRQTPFQLIFG